MSHFAATVTFKRDDDALARFRVEQGGQLRTMGKMLAFFLYDLDAARDASVDPDVGSTAVQFGAALHKHVPGLAVSVSRSPVKTATRDIEYEVSWQGGQWNVSILRNTSNTLRNLDLSKFMEAVGADTNKRVVPKASKEAGKPEVKKRRISDSGYQLFGAMMRPKIAKLDLKPTERMKEIAAQWKALPDDEKDKWKAESAKMRAEKEKQLLASSESGK